MYSACREHTSKGLRNGTRSQGISQFYLHTPRSSADEMNHTCLYLPSRSWYSFTDFGGMEGRVGLVCLYHVYTVWVKKAVPLQFFAIFSLLVNLCHRKLPWVLHCPNIFLCLHQFWSIYLNICINCIILLVRPQILTIQFRLLQNSWIFR